MELPLPVQAVWAFLLIVVLMYCPGRLFLRLLGLSVSPIETAALALGAGIALLIFGYWFLAAAGLASWLPILGGVAGVTELAISIRVRRQPTGLPPSGNVELTPGWPFWLITGAVILLQGRMMFPSGLMTGHGFVLFNTNAGDAPSHVFVMEALSHTYPAACPGLSGHLLQNYHYFFNLLWGALIRIAPLDPWDVYFRLSPAFGSFLLCLSAYVAGSDWARSRTAGYVAVVMTALCSNFGVLAGLFSMDGLPAGWNSILWVQPPPEGVLTPPGFLSYALMLFGWRTLNGWVREQNRASLVATWLIWGILPGVKIYAAILVLTGLAAGGLWEFLFQRRIRLWIAALGLLPLYLFEIRLITPTGGSLLLFFPGFNLAAMLTLPGRMNAMSAASFAALYTRHPLAAAMLIGLLIPVFAFGNLGVRLIGVPAVWRAFINPRTSDPLLFFLLAAAGAGVCAAVLFIQAGAHQWNTIQFYYFTVLLSAIPAAGTMASWLKNHSRRAGIAAWMALFIIGIVPFLHDLWASEMVTQAMAAPPPLVNACLWIRHHTPRESVVLCPLPTDLLQNGYHSWQALKTRAALRTRKDWQREAERRQNAPATAPKALPVIRLGRIRLSVTDQWGSCLVAALSGRQTYLEQPLVTLQRTNGAPLDERIREVTAFYNDPRSDASLRFLSKAGIDLVLLFPGMPDLASPARLMKSDEGYRVFEFSPLP